MKEFFDQCSQIFLGVLDGNYGWVTETAVLFGVVLLFNFVVKWILRKLHERFEKQGKLWHDSFVRALYKPLSYFVWFFAGVQLLELIDKYTLSQFSISNVHHTLAIGAIVALGWFALRWKNNLKTYVTNKSKNHELALDQTKIDVIDKLVTLVIIFTTILLLLDVTGSSLNTIIAFGGIGGLAIAFASQEMIANFFAGMMIYVTHPFSKGEWVQLPERQIEGHVEEIGWYMTRIRSLDKRPIYVPNSIFSKVVVINPSRMSCRQFKEILALRLEDLSKIKPYMHELTHLLEQHPLIANAHPVTVTIAGFANNTLDLNVSAYANVLDNDAYSRLKSDLFFLISDLLQKHEIEFSTPTTLVAFQKTRDEVVWNLLQKDLKRELQNYNNESQVNSH